METSRLEKRKRSKKNLVFSLTSQILIAAVSLFLPRLYLVHFGSEVNGLLNSVTQVVAYLSLFEAGIAATALQALYKPVSLGETDKVNRILVAVRFHYLNLGKYYLITLTLVAVVYPLFIVRESVSYAATMLIIWISGGSFVLLFFVQGKYKVLLQAEGKSYILVNVQTSTTILASIAKMVFISLNLNVLIVVLVGFVISVLEAVFIVIYIRISYGWIDLGVDKSETSLREKNYVLMHQVAFIIFQNTDMILLTLIGGLKVVSVYAVYKLVARHIASLLYIPFHSISFALGQLFHNSVNKFIEIIDLVDILYGAFCFSVLSVVLKLYPPFIALYTSGVGDVDYSIKMLPLLFVLTELLVFFRYPMQNVIQYAGHFKSTLPQTFIETGINIVVSVALVKWLGVVGVLIGTISALMYRAFEMVIYSNTKILHRSPKFTFLVYALHLSVFIFVQAILSLINLSIGSILEFLIAGLVCMIVSAALFALVTFIVFPKQIQTAYRIIRDNRLQTNNQEGV